MIEKLSGIKTYVAIALAFAWAVIWLKIPGAKAAISLEDFGTVLAALLALGGVSMRAGVQKAQDAKDDAAIAAEKKPS